MDSASTEDGNGTKNHPYKTIEEAQTKVREIVNGNNYPTKGIKVYLREGNYTLSDTVTFNEQDSGKENAPVVWSAYGDEKVTISNSTQISLDKFTVSNDSRIPASAQGKVLSYNLKNNGISGYDGLYLAGHSQYYYWAFGMAEPDSVKFGYAVPEVFFGNETGKLAQYPNDGWLGITSLVERGTSGWFTSDTSGTKLTSWTGATMKVNVSKDRMAKWETAQNPWYDSYWKYDWSDMRGPFKSISSANQTITTEHALPYEPTPSSAKWKIYNLLEELDTAGEWYYDEESGELFIYPTNTMKETDNITLAFQKKNIFELKNAHDITFKNLELTGTRFCGISGSNCKRINVGNCHIYNLSTDGIALTSSDDCKIYRNTIENIGAKGIQLTGGSKTNLTSSGNIIENNLIKNFARLQKSYIGGVDIHGVGVTVRNNEICYAPQLAIAYGGNDHLIENNDIHNVLSEASDMGAIYRINGFASRGTVIRNNAFHDLKTESSNSTGIFAIYFDGAAPGDTATQNVFYNITGSGIFMNCGSNLTVTNNIFANVSKAGIRFACVEATADAVKNLSTEGAESYLTNTNFAKYPNFYETFSSDKVSDGSWRATRNCVVKNNIGYKTSKVTTYDLGGASNTKYLYSPYNDYNVGTNYTTDPGFTDLLSNNYTLKESNSVTTKYSDFISVDMSKIGIQN